MARKQSIIFLSSVLSAAAFSQGGSACHAESFQHYQDARTQKPGSYEITPNVASVSFTDEGETDHTQNQLGAGVAFGLTPRADLRATLTRIDWVDFDLGANSFVFGPKFSVSPGQLAIFVPFDFWFGEDVRKTSETWEFCPTLLLTSPIRENFEINPSASARIPLYEDGKTLLAFNLGMGIGSTSSPFYLRPSFGLIVNPGEPGESGFGWSLGLGLSFRSDT